MATIAQGMITLNSVNDAFSVSLSPSSCVINADYNGQNPKLDYAYSDIRVIRGETAMAFDKPIILSTSNTATAEIIKVDITTWRIKILTIPTTDLTGNFQLQIKVGDEFVTAATFSYTVVRETSMLDWILDWNGTYTEITGKWVITPKIFAGTKNADGQITGVYMGPSFDNNGSTGLYGYKNDDIIFQLTETGGVIGGWQINNGGIQTSDGFLKILSEGSIISTPNNTMAWQLNKDGSASFAGGKVNFYSNGDADFEGTITAISGEIGGWKIGEHSLRAKSILIDSVSRYIGIYNSSTMVYYAEPTADQFHKFVKVYGGVAMFYTNGNSYGLEGWLPCGTTANIDDDKKVFSLGSQNRIAGWNFDNNALYLGTKNNTARQTTSADGFITIGTAGIRGRNWYIDTDGEISFVGGLLHFTKDGGTIAGWKLNSDHFATSKAALVSATGYTGLFLSNTDLPEAYTNFDSHIRKHGGIYLAILPSGPTLRGQDDEGKMTFQLTNSISYIGGWWFSNECLFTGAQSTPSGQFAKAGNITLSPDGLRGYKFRLEADGSGAIAGGHISWNTNGDITLDSTVKIAWDNVTGTDGVMTKGTYFDANGIFTGKIDANLITTGKLKADRIDADELFSVEGKWALKRDGSGYLAAKNIEWDQDGKLTVKGRIEANSGSIAGFVISDGYIGVDSSLNDEPSSSNPQASWANLTISKDFLKVGGNKGYVMFGNDVIPGSAGGAFTAVGRIVNNAPNTMGSYRFDQANYGLFIDVTGGTKNYGISSNAALLAPAFVTTGATFLTFDSSGTYSLDFSQNNLILLYAPTATNMTLPQEASVARQFGYYNNLPDDFVAIVTIMLRPGSQFVILKDIYNGTGSKSDYPIATSRYVYKDCTYQMQYGGSQGVRQIAPCCITLMISKKDGFRYTLVNYECSLEKA